MAKGTVNKVFLVGDVAAPPMIKHNDKCDYAHICLLTMHIWRDKISNQEKESTQWHQIAIYGKLVNIVDKYIHKGDKISIIGRLQTRKWADEHGKEHERIEIIGEELQMLSHQLVSQYE